MIYTIKSELVGGMHMPEQEVIRTIRIGGSASLDDLCEVMLRSLDFDRDHMYQFCMDNNAHSRNAFISGSDRGGKASTKEKLYKLGLKTGKKFLFIYDFGDEWMFQMEVLEVENKSGNIRTEVVESIGAAEQYPDWEDEENNAPGKKKSRSGRQYGPGVDVLEGLLKDEDELDFSEEYFDEDYEVIGEESNPRLGRLVLRITEHQIETKSPAFVEKAYIALQKKGYIRKLAKVKLATALINEIFEIVKYNKPHSEERYRAFVEEAVREDFNEDSVIDIETGRERTISELLYEFEELVMEENASDEATDAFLEVWPKLKAYIDDNYTRETEDGLQRLTPGQIDERTEYRMDIYNSVTDADMAFLNAGRYEEGVRVLGEILQTFAWEKDEDASIRGGIGDCLERSGKKGEADKWFEAWLSERPKDPHCANYYVMALMDRGDLEKAGKVLTDCLPEGLPAEERYEDIYMRAEAYYSAKGDQVKAKVFTGLSEKIKKLYLEEYSEDDFKGGEIRFGGMFDPEHPSYIGNLKHAPTVVNATKIYPNDPCPCGSGKKYKKCCGKNK